MKSGIKEALYRYEFDLIASGGREPLVHLNKFNCEGVCSINQSGMIQTPGVFSRVWPGASGIDVYDQSLGRLLSYFNS